MNAPTHVTRAFDSAKHCGAKRHRDGLPCVLSKGAATDHLGSGHCKYHGGSSRNGRTHGKREATERAVANALAVLHIDAAVDPTEALLEALRVACWREIGLRQMMAARPSLFGPDHNDDNRPDVVAVMHAEALEQRAKIAKMAIDAGIDAAMVRIAERQAEVTVRAVQAAIDSMVSTGDRQQAEAAAASVLEAVAPAGVSLN